MKIFFVIIIIAHGLIHLLAFVKAYNLAPVDQLKEQVTKPAGAFWLAAACLYVGAALLYLMNQEYWWVLGVIALLVSQTLIFLSWQDAKFGTIVTVLILIPLVIALADALPGSFPSIFKEETRKGINRLGDVSLVTEEDLQHLPKPVQAYLRYTGTVGKPKIQNFMATFEGEIRRSQESAWMDFSSKQYNFFDDPTRIFFIKSNVFGVPFDGLHVYAGSSATMQIKIASLFRIVDAKGDTMTRGETVTLFNDMCVMAPATLIDTGIGWESIDSVTAKGIFTNKGITISAILSFNEAGALVDFSSDDRYLSADGMVYQRYRWTTPMRDYKEFDGRKVATKAELIWHMPEREFIYGRFELSRIEYNCRTFR